MPVRSELTALISAPTVAESIQAKEPVVSAQIVKVVDGDTYQVDIPLTATRKADQPIGFGLRVHAHRLILRTNLRLAGYNAAEHDTGGGDAATAYVSGLLPVGAMIKIPTEVADKYGQRWDAKVTLPDGRDLGELLYSMGWVARYNGTGPKPVPVYPPVPPAPG